MNKHHAYAIALAVALAVPSQALAAQTASATGTVCGRVDAPALTILQLERQATPANIVIARSARGEARATVGIDGSYCFTGLEAGLYTITAFEDGYPQYRASVTAQQGKTVVLDLFAAAE